MKTPNYYLLTGLVALTFSTAVEAQTEFVNVVEMVELGDEGESDLIWRMPGNVPDDGFNVLVGEPLPENGAIFLLSTVQTTPTFIDWYLDQTAVGGYLPRVEMKVFTHDVESTIPRVRADQPIELEVTVSGLYETGSTLVDETLIQQAAKEVRLQVFAQDYPEGVSSLPGGEVTNPAHSEFVLQGNGDFPAAVGDLTFYSSLNSTRPDKARGEERFVVRSLSDGGFAEAAIEEVGVQVWPVWGSSMTGLERPTFLPYQFTGSQAQMKAQEQDPVTPVKDFSAAPDFMTYEGKPPEISFSWTDLYPSTTVGVIVNDASKPYPWGGSWVGGTKRVFNEDGSFDYGITVTDWGNVFSGPGRYAIWIVVHTPGIGWEVGGQYDSAGNVQPGGWVVPIARGGIRLRGSVHSLAE